MIIVSYNTKELTFDCLDSVARDLRRSVTLLPATEMIVIDNKSTDGSVEAIKQFAKENKDIKITLIENPKNTGFAAANNLGIAKAKGRYLLLLNSDTYVQAGALEQLVMSFEVLPQDNTSSVLSSEPRKLNRLGILAATLINKDGTYQPQGGGFPNLLSIMNHMLLLDDLPLIGKFLPSTQHTGHNGRGFSLNEPIQSMELRQRDWVAGTAMMIHREVIDEIGNLDEHLFMYGEDVEFCMRARKHHWDIAEHPGARITHFRSQSSSKTNAIVGEFKGYYYIWSKHKPLWQEPFLKFFLQVGALLRKAIFGKIAGKADLADAYQQALLAIPRNRR